MIFPTYTTDAKLMRLLGDPTSLYFAVKLYFFDIWTQISQTAERRPIKRAEPVTLTQTFRPSSPILGGRVRNWRQFSTPVAFESLRLSFRNGAIHQ